MSYLLSSRPTTLKRAMAERCSIPLAGDNNNAHAALAPPGLPADWAPALAHD